MPVKNIVIGQSVSYEMHERAKQLRREMTPAEKSLWKELRTNKLSDLHFRRQQIIDGYIADFYCHQYVLIVEIDGNIHELQKDYDGDRDQYLMARGFHVLRFTNDEIMNDLQGVLEKILEECRKDEIT
jgi:very-short-patch-repair endonuclease